MNTAVILAARKETNSCIPYPLKEFPIGDGKKTCLLERILLILEECSFNNILIVVGYQRHLFSKFANKRVQLIDNKEYEFTSSMGSLAVVEPYIKEDFLLIESDTFFEKKLIESVSKVEEGNCFCITGESGNRDEAFVQLRQGRVQRISKDYHQISHIDGEMMGVTRIKKDTFYLMCRAYEHATNKRVNYEYLLLDSTELIDRRYLMFPNLIWGEADNEDDFRMLSNYVYPRLRRKENPYDKENLYAHLRKIFSEKHIDESWQIEQIGGMSNKNFKVTSPDGCEYVLRVPGIGSEGMVERNNEDVNGMLGCRLGLNPSIRYFDKSTGIKLADYIHNAEPLNAGTIQRMSNMNQIAAIFKTLHSAKVRFNNEFNIFHEIVKYENLLAKAHGNMYEGFEKIREQVLALEDYLFELGVEVKPCHNDLVAENFIMDENGKIFLIDWEYSGMNDPMADFAALFLENNYTAENVDYVLKKYFDGNIPEGTYQKILAYQVLWDYLWALWTCIKEAEGDDFGTYGLDRYNRAIKNLKLISIK